MAEIDRIPTRKENPVLEDEEPRRPSFDKGVDPERPPELAERLAKIEEQDITGKGQQAPRPYAMQGEDEGPLGAGGQLRDPDAGGGGS